MAYKKTNTICPFCQIGHEEWDMSSGYYNPNYINVRCDSCGASGQAGDFRTDSFMTRKREELFRIGNSYRARYSHLYPKWKKR